MLFKTTDNFCVCQIFSESVTPDFSLQLSVCLWGLAVLPVHKNALYIYICMKSTRGKCVYIIWLAIKV